MIKNRMHEAFWSWFIVWFKNWFNPDWEQLYKLFLVTNLHVIQWQEEIFVCINKIWWWVWEEAIQSKSWIKKEWIDIALTTINWNYLKRWNYTINFISEENLITQKEEYLERLETWEEIYLLWFPLWIAWLSLHNAIARQWIIARIDNELLENNEIYFDVNNFPWNSGWPVITKPNIISLNGKKPWTESMLIGLIRSYIPSHKTYYDITQNPPIPTMTVSENSWIWIWIPSYIIAELVQNELWMTKNQ